MFCATKKLSVLCLNVKKNVLIKKYGFRNTQQSVRILNLIFVSMFFLSLFFSCGVLSLFFEIIQFSSCMFRYFLSFRHLIHFMSFSLISFLAGSFWCSNNTTPLHELHLNVFLFYFFKCFREISNILIGYWSFPRRCQSEMVGSGTWITIANK